MDSKCRYPCSRCVRRYIIWWLHTRV